MPWAIYANFPNFIQSKRLDGNYISRTEAEAIAAKYLRMLGRTVPFASFGFRKINPQLY